MTCETLEMTIGLVPGILRGLLNIPMGNTHAFGSYEGCLASKSFVSPFPSGPCLQPETNTTVDCNPLNIGTDIQTFFLVFKILD